VRAGIITMHDTIWAIGEALTWGITTAMNPCPLTANIAALAFLGRRLGSPRQVFLAGLLYALGGTLAYALLAMLLLAGIQASPLAWFLEGYLHQSQGPLFIVVGMVLLGWIGLPGVPLRLDAAFHARVERWGLWAALPLGILLALGFCPASAACFFSGVFRMAAQHNARLLLPACYGLGTALPVLLAASLLAFGARLLSPALGVLARTARWGQRLAGTVLILTGIYLSLRLIFHLW